MKTSLKIQLVTLIIIFLVISLAITGLILDSQDKLFPLFHKVSQIEDSGGDSGERGLTVKEKESQLDEETLKRINELEEKIKEFEDKQNVPFPDDGDGSFPSLAQEQISAVVELWCPDDDYRYNGFVSIGSGSIVHPKGIIFTNRHVISNYDWSVIMSSPTCYVAITDNIAYPPEMKYMADLVAYSPAADEYLGFDFDIAVLHIYDVCHECEGAPESLPESFPYLELGYSDILAPGDYVAIAGYPEIGAGTFNFTNGIISGRVGEFVLKTDAKIDSGNSGGSALNNLNQLIGLPTWTIIGQTESIGYIIGIDQIIQWYEEKVMPSDSIIVPY